MPLEIVPLTTGIFVSAAMWTLLHSVITPWLSKTFFTTYYEKLLEHSEDPGEDGQKMRVKLADWNGRVPGFIHAVSISALAIYCKYFDEQLYNDKLKGTSNAWLVTVSVAAGFFMWDLGICLYHVKLYGWTMVFHACFCLVTYLICGYVREVPMAWHACSFLLFELSTPILHIRATLIDYKASSTLITYATYAFGIAFTLVRIIWGNFYAFPPVWRVLWNKPKEMPVWQAAFFWCNSIASATLNTYWMYQIAASAMKTRKPKKAKES